MNLNYFSCTLGQAVNHQQDKSYKTINDFLDVKAKEEPHAQAVGFYSPQPQSSLPCNSQILSFQDVYRRSLAAAEDVSAKLGTQPGQTVALLCPSSADFLFVWLALIRLGHPVLLLAPQCSPSAILHLCEVCEVACLLYDEVYEDLASQASTMSSKSGCARLQTVLIPPSADDLDGIPLHPGERFEAKSVAAGENAVAYLHHTSGTSTGMPKPIPQTHRAAVGVLPTLDGRRHATFTTTPLYHGGIADLFRAWTSNAMIWLFPGKTLPITATNIHRCLDTSSKCAKGGEASQVKYFSSVPYVLQMMADDERGLDHLQRMDIVGVGGAALPVDVGNRLVEHNVNLISRFGSAECGFLMSSYRDFAKDKEWQYLRSNYGGEHAGFELQNDGLVELVIRQGWPHMAKHNRKDGSYATADLFAPHPTIPRAWRYHSRADSQLTLITGKKFDPAPLEDALCASTSFLEDVLVFGEGRPYPGVLLFRSAEAVSISDQDLLRDISPTVEELNRDSQSHARIPQDMLIPMPHSEKRLERSSKGTVLRRSAQERYAEQIQKAYLHVAGDDASFISDDDVPDEIYKIISSVLGGGSAHGHGEALSDQTDLFTYGVDSVASIQIRNALCRLIPTGSTLPRTVVEDAGTVQRLCDLILRVRAGRAVEDVGRGAADQEQLMLDMVKRYSVFNDAGSPASSNLTDDPVEPQASDSKIQVLLTGATGSLGSHILHQLLSDPGISKVRLALRGSSPPASRERVLQALSRRLLTIPADFDSKTTLYQCNLSDARLGLCNSEYEDLARNVDIIIHLAWSVNFLLPLRSFGDAHLAGLRNLIDLALACPTRPSPPRFVFCSSVAAVSNYTRAHQPQLATLSPAIVPETTIPSPSVSGATGYARSKWVAERMCTTAHERTRLRYRISIARVGQLSGASDTGVWSASEAYPLMLASMKATGALPDLQREVLNWLPVDVAARAFVEDALRGSDDATHASSGSHGGGGGGGGEEKGNPSSPPVHHVLNPNNDLHWTQLLTYLSRHASFQTVAVKEWLHRLSCLQDGPETKSHPALRLLGFWENAYAGAEPQCQNPEPGRQNGLDGASPRRPIEYAMDSTYTRMPMLRPGHSSWSLDEEYILKVWNRINEDKGTL